MPFLSLLIIFILHSPLLASYVLAPLAAQTVINEPVVLGVVEEIVEPQRIYDTKSIGVVVSAKSSFVIDTKTDYIFWEQAADEVLPIASITKLASVATLLDMGIDLNQIVTVTASDLRPEGGNRHIYLGEKILAFDLLHAVLIASDNEALTALVRSIGVSEQEFVEQVNQWAQDNGLKTFHIVEPTGLSSYNIASAHDIAKLAQIVFSQELVANIAQKQIYTFQSINTKRIIKLDNTNRLLNSLFAVEMGKTGFIDESGYCLVTLARIVDGREVISVVLGSDSIISRFQDTKALLYWVGENYKW